MTLRHSVKALVWTGLMLGCWSKVAPSDEKASEPPTQDFGGALETKSPVQPESGCRAWKDKDRLLGLGRFAMGTPFQNLPKTLRRSRGCFISEDFSTIDCEVLDDDGIAYLLDEIGVLRVEARSDDAQEDVRLPLGLKFGDSRNRVLEKLEGLPPESPRNQLRLAARASSAIASGFCVIHGSSAPASWYVGFDAEGRLRTVGLRLNAG